MIQAKLTAFQNLAQCREGGKCVARETRSPPQHQSAVIAMVMGWHCHRGGPKHQHKSGPVAPDFTERTSESNSFPSPLEDESTISVLS